MKYMNTVWSYGQVAGPLYTTNVFGNCDNFNNSKNYTSVARNGINCEINSSYGISNVALLLEPLVQTTELITSHIRNAQSALNMALESRYVLPLNWTTISQFTIHITTANIPMLLLHLKLYSLQYVHAHMNTTFNKILWST